jgi:serine protease Do
MPGRPGQGPRSGMSQGSGFIISADGYVLTNHHVIEGATNIVVRLNDRNELKAELVGSDPLSDVALLKVDGRGLPVLKIGDSRGLKAGQWVLAIGSPFGFEHSVTAGIVSGVGRRSLDPSQQYVPFIQTDVAINRGNSGGPLLNTRGEVVGINSQIFSNSGGYMGVSFAIPIEVAMNAVRQLRDTGKVVRGQLGVRIQDVDRERLAELGLDRPVGAFVDSVENGSAAAKAGIRPGDVITRFNGREIGRSAELPPMVGAMPPGSRASVGLMRDGKPLDLVVTLAALDLAEAPSTPAGPGAAPAPAAGNALGVVVEELDASARGALGLKAGEGVLVGRVVGLAARQAGLAPGDVILQVGRADVGSVAEFNAAVKDLASGDEVRLLVRNARSTGFVTFTLR